MALNDEPSLADYFGFEPLEVIRIGRSAGPATTADMNGNGKLDLIVVNNHNSRIEIHSQKEDASPEDSSPPSRVNEFPEHWRFERTNVSVLHHVTAVIAHDFDGDGMKDLIYVGRPGELVFLRQVSPGTFQVSRRHRIRNLSADQGSLRIANVIGDDQPELITLVNGEIHIFPLDGDEVGTPTRLAAGDRMGAFHIEDFNGNGRLDVLGVITESSAPLRVWFGREGEATRSLGPQVRFELPSLRDVTPVKLPGHDGTRVALIERSSKRIVTYEFVTEELERISSGDAPYHVHSFTDPGNRSRDLIIADINGDGRRDVIATDTRANAVAVFRQRAKRGLAAPESFPSLADVKVLAAGPTGENGRTELFVLSEEEGVVGRSRITRNGIEFPEPLRMSEGYTPVTMQLAKLGDRHHLAVVAKENREHKLELLDLRGGRESLELGELVRSPETIIPIDADQDGRTDLLLLTRDRPMVMVHAGEDGYTIREAREMGQSGLVQAARAENTAVFDIDGNGRPELLIADRNYIRAVRYNDDPPAGVSPGWQVVTQINAEDSSARLVSLAIMDNRIVAADRENNRLLMFSRSSGAASGWRQTEAIGVTGFQLERIHAGAFSGDGRSNVLAVGNDGLAVIQLGGERITLRETDGWRPSEESQAHHRLAAGDVNGDGFIDLIALDSGDQRCDIFTYSARGRKHFATSFQVYESRIFSGGASREYQPNQAIIADVTGNGADDLILMSHDRVLLYPQMTEAKKRSGEE
ncbi:MAG: VCBS repeat-containing protein [Phycisphaerales bacterium]|nr:MAG: VCBS repeat-containing protein [Phycisphaerales bacterium]